MRIINTGKDPYYWTFDGKQWGPLAPGQVGNYPDEIANHAIRRSVVNDDIGNPVDYTIKTVAEARLDPKEFQRIVRYECPMVQTEQCNHPGFDSLDALREHMNQHFNVPKSEGKTNVFSQTATKGKD